MPKTGTKKNSNTRKLIISNYRNIGITFDDTEKPAELVLNRSIKPDDLGDLLLLVGPNNSGKSNVLAALDAFGSGTVEKDDFPDFLYCDTPPEIVMKITNENFEKELRLSSKDIEKNPKDAGSDPALKKHMGDLKKISNERHKLEKEIEMLREKILYARLNKEETLKLNNFDGKVLDSVGIAELKESLEHPPKDARGITNFKYMVEKRLEELTIGEQLSDKEEELTVKKSIETTLKNEIQKKEEVAISQHNYVVDGNDMQECDYLLSPKIVTYKQIHVTQNDLSCKPNDLSDFMKNILTIMGIKTSSLENVYSQNVTKRRKGYLRRFAEELNKIVPIMITDRFNKMYYCKDGEEYKFMFDLETDWVNVELSRGDVPLDLDRQSTGFRWFFDFFFNFVNKEELKRGDIVLMDEPATNLHVSGQIELRDFLKEIAMKNGLTFVISTHSPFMVNCDYLDELRLMVRDKRGFVRIADKFDIVSESADKLDPVLNGLTVGRHILVGPKQKVIFTEGITDYDYLTSFKLLFARENDEYKRLTFLPVGGVKNDKLLSILSEINSRPMLLVDSDGPGIDILVKSKDTGVSVVSLAEVDGEKGHYKTIETLFTVEDRERFALYEKNWNSASLFKRNIFENEKTVSDTTKTRFRKVLDWLLDV